MNMIATAMKIKNIENLGAIWDLLTLQYLKKSIQSGSRLSCQAASFLALRYRDKMFRLGARLRLFIAFIHSYLNYILQMC